MRTKRTILVEKEITTYTCDCCGHSTEQNGGCCGTAPIMKCDFCGNDCCHNCRDFFSEYVHSDYPHGLWACSDCADKASQAWDEAQETAGRHDDIHELTLKIFKDDPCCK